MTGQLFLVSTPIGNLKDITLRALETLFGSDIIACEDVRLTKNLISHFKNKINTGKIKLEGITTKFDAELISYYDEVEQYKTPELIDLLISGKISVDSEGKIGWIFYPLESEKRLKKAHLIWKK